MANDAERGEPMKTKVEGPGINQHISPLCPRDNNTMTFEPHAIHWRRETDAKEKSDAQELAATTQPFEYEDTDESIGSYYCGDHGCSVRYTPEQGYFSVVEVPEQPYFVDEPGANTLTCPIHKTWLYRREREDEEGFEWACGTEDCDYRHEDVPGDWLRQ
jgi:hypothetical protein